MNKVKLAISSLIFSICCLLFAFCSAPFFELPEDEILPPVVEQGTQEAQDVPAGMGYFSLSVDFAARTILPIDPGFKTYQLNFVPNDDCENDNPTMASIYRTESNKNDPVLLRAGIWDLVVTAYTDEGNSDDPPKVNAASGFLEGININGGTLTTNTVTLTPIEEGKGTFRWRITYPDNVTSGNAVMTVTPYADETAKEEITLTGATEFTNTELDSGYHEVKITLTNSDGKTAFITRTLHIQTNMVSEFDHPFTASNFFAELSGTVTITGNPWEDETLTAVPVLSGTSETIYYQWKRGGVNIDGAISENYTVTDADTVGAQITVEVYRAGYIGSVTSAPVVVKEAVFDFYKEIEKYANATGSMTISVPNDITLTENVTIPVRMGSTLTITSVDPDKPVTIYRGVADTNPDNGLFILTGLNANLILENIVIDGNHIVDGAVNFGDNAAPLVRTGGTFTLGEGAVLQNNRATNGGGVYLQSPGSSTLNGGIIQNNTSVPGSSTGGGGGVYVSSGTFNMTRGTIKDNLVDGTPTGSQRGGGVFVTSSGAFRMSGGEITGNKANGGGGVCVNGNNFTMRGGTISDNEAYGTSSSSGGGGVYVGGLLGGRFSMYGGEIKENKATMNGGGVYVSTSASGVFRVGGTAKINGNAKTSDMTGNNNVYLENNKYITLADGTGTGDDLQTLPADGMEVYVHTARTDGVIVDTGASAGVVRFFRADEAGKEVVLNGEQLVIVNSSPSKITDASQIVDYLLAQTGGDDPDDPIILPLETLDDWQAVLTAIAAAGKFVELDLSDCTRYTAGFGGDFNGTFDADINIHDNKDKIVSLILPDEATTVQGIGPYFTNLKSVSGKGITNIRANAFDGCTILKADFPLAESIGSSAFYGCTSLTKADFPSVASIGSSAFDGCTSLTEANFPLVESIGNIAFYDCTSLTEVYFPLAESIGNTAFYNCTSLTEVYFPLAENIGNSAFYGCTNLVEVNIPLVTSIGNSAFGYTSTPLIVFLGNVAPTVGTNMLLGGGAKTVTVKVPAGTTDYGDIPETYTTDTTSQNWGNAFRGMGWNPGNADWAANGSYGTGTANGNVTLVIEYE